MRRVKIHEVGPRDGLQNHAQLLSVASRVALVERLVSAGVQDVEVGAMVHPKWIPQMRGSDEVFRRMVKQEGVRYWVLVPNFVGYERAMSVGVTHFCVTVSASQVHNRKNLNCRVEESMSGIVGICREALAREGTLRGYISMVFGNPFGDDVTLDTIISLAEQMLEAGVSQVALGDTVGVATPSEVSRVCCAIKEYFGGLQHFALHLHDTNSMALQNVVRGYEVGIRTFDGSIGGLGGCPYAGDGAKGNVRTESLLEVLEGLGAECGIELSALQEVWSWFSQELLCETECG